ncbi:MAG: DUF1566 domain-containing protein [Prevotellaceae bacterium]|jgi:hypothetical protein|nr:DUF1566 domain-containing protein [Prevotellaceae bacterium]
MKKIFYFMATATALMCGCAEDEGSEEGQTAAAQIHGTVVANGEPVNAAAILLTPGGGTKVTGSDGMYDFSDLQPGRYELKAYKESYQSFNKSIDLAAGKNEELAITLTASTGKLSLNKAYVDMGSNESNNVAGFSIVNSGNAELAWSITNAAGWITQIDPQSGTVSANSSEAVVFTIDRSRLSANTEDNHATLIVRSTTAGDGSAAELLVTVFGIGNGTNTTIGNDKDYVVIGDLYVQTQDMGGRMDWTSANSSCEGATTGGFDDWYLPSMSELGVLYAKNVAIGGFVNENSETESSYWSKDSYNTNYHYLIAFSDGQQGRAYGASWTTGSSSSSYFDGARCRCVRKASPLPVVSTLPATNVTANAATLNGKIENKGEPAFTERGFVYSNTFQNPTVEDGVATTTKRAVSGTSTDFSANIASLTAEAAYYVRAYAINSNGTVYGESLSFKPTAVVDYVVLQSEGIMVQKNDISSGTDWVSAGNLCRASSVGGYSDWRLPTRGELSALYSNRATIGGFSSNNYYWTSDVYSSYNYQYYHLSFATGSTSYSYSSSSYRARAVRTLP